MKNPNPPSSSAPARGELLVPLGDKPLSAKEFIALTIEGIKSTGRPVTVRAECEDSTVTLQIAIKGVDWQAPAAKPSGLEQLDIPAVLQQERALSGAILTLINSAQVDHPAALGALVSVLTVVGMQHACCASNLSEVLLALGADLLKLDAAHASGAPASAVGPITTTRH